MSIATVKPTLSIGSITEPARFPLSQVAAIARQLVANVEKVIVGKHEKIALAVATLLAEGHLLIEDVPGVAKTMLARALAQSAGCSFKRVQCTPDLEPSDVLGESFIDKETGRPDFRFGPLFSQFVLVDEINRASPRTQAALLEAMGEASVTEGKITYQMARPFMVIATQNPIEHEGTFQLPEAQKDRFLIRLNLGYPSLEDEKEMCGRFQLGHPIETLKPVTSPDRILACQQAVRELEVSSEVCDYLLGLVRATREHPVLLLGASPRGSLGLFRMAQAMSAMQGNDSVSIEQIKAVAATILAHRLIVKPERTHRYHDCREIIQDIIEGKKPD
jgi:MoxR-like ATPase